MLSVGDKVIECVSDFICVTMFIWENLKMFIWVTFSSPGNDTKRWTWMMDCSFLPFVYLFTLSIVWTFWPLKSLYFKIYCFFSVLWCQRQHSHTLTYGILKALTLTAHPPFFPGQQTKQLVNAWYMQSFGVCIVVHVTKSELNFVFIEQSPD